MIGWMLAGVAVAAEWPLMDTIAEWAERSVQDYTLNGVQPRRAEIAVLDRDGWFVDASLGALISDQGWRTRPGRVEVVVGDAVRDSSRFRRDRNGLDVAAHPRFVVDDVPIAVARDLWLATDSSFKAAVKQYEVKSAALAQLGGTYPPDWSDAPIVQHHDLAELPDLDPERLRAIALQGSGALRGVGGLRNGRVEANAIQAHYALATSEGTRVVQPEGHAVVYAWADLVRDDGVQVYEYRQWVARTTADLPATEVLVREIEALGRRVVARSRAEVVAYYEGPVVFEGDAAADLFRYLAIPEVLGTPPPPRADRTYEQLTRSGPRIGRRLLGPGWSLVDDPTARPSVHAGSFDFDRQGVRAERVELVQDGRVEDLLTTRVPRHDRARSNGHCRGRLQDDWEARESVWTVAPPRMLSDRSFDRQVDKLLRQSQDGGVLVVRALERGRGERIPRPTDAVWRSADGSERPVLLLDFQNDDRRALRDIVAVGGGMKTRPYLMASTAGGAADGSAGLPAVGIAPGRVLVGELEAVYPGGNVEPPALPPPPL